MFTPKRMGCAIAVITFVVIAAFFAGSLLIVQAPTQTADAIVVLGGDHVMERVTHAAELYRQGCAPRVVICGGVVGLWGDEPLTEAQMMQRQIVRLGVPQAATLLEQNSKTTVQNAQFAKTILAQNNINSILLVTSPYHSARATRIFRDTLGSSVSISSQPALDSDFCARCWTMDSIDRFLVVSEYWKWAIYLIAHQ